jgi:glycosyltransferase involved in cell wall biosynthesis
MYFPRDNGFWHYAFKLLFRASGTIICNHEPVRALIAAYGVPSARIHAVPAFSVQYQQRFDAFLPPPVEHFFKSHSPVLFSYALFRPEFTIEDLMHAFEHVRSVHPLAGLLIIGPSDVPVAFRDRLRELQDAVLVAGNLPHDQFLSALSRSDVFVRTHLRDGVCASVLEALALGIPVVASDDGIRPASVVTYAPGDLADFRQQLMSVVSDLSAARARVTPPVQDDHLARQIALVMDAAS